MANDAGPNPMHTRSCLYWRPEPASDWLAISASIAMFRLVGGRKKYLFYVLEYLPEVYCILTTICQMIIGVDEVHELDTGTVSSAHTKQFMVLDLRPFSRRLFS